MKKFTCGFENSGVFLWECERVEDLKNFLDGNNANYEDADFETKEGNYTAVVSNQDNINYIDNINITW